MSDFTAKKLKEARNAANLSQEQVAKALGIALFTMQTLGIGSCALAAKPATILNSCGASSWDISLAPYIFNTMVSLNQ